ncbi:vWA domain-containing protein [Ketobacter sp.]|uniref:vWA domain-containing protein n=1 Tax=Ketobacter sp. TaxID=2083498 RepID=UPI000F0E9D16|nr:vWA domain-containing protein [Ketobacter sp.]RLU00657.1 MAG: VWA domain-containing protein [Ketobacter sp.]
MPITMKPLLLAGLFGLGTAAAVAMNLVVEPIPHTPMANPPQSLPADPVTVHQPHGHILHPNQRPQVEVVFVLDTTSSMSGLIDAAKNNIWSIASSMASADPEPDMRMGLVAFRDRGDAYVTWALDLSQDLDAMYLALSNFKAQGGGDGPESVNAALHAAVNNMAWSQDEQTYKVIFLVGDAPPHMDYADEPQYPAIIEQARAKGIVVNCIQAGNQADTRKVWQQIASLNQGEFFQVEQGGNAIAVTTPFDEQIARLSRELDATKLFYGSEEKRQRLQEKEKASRQLFASVPASVQAKRAEYNTKAAGADNLFADSELVEDVASGRVELDAVPEQSLPEPLLGLDKDERKKQVQQTAEKRQQLQAEIAELGKQRQAYIAAQLKSDDVAQSLDGKIYEAIRSQAGSKGLQYESGPSF